MRWLLVILVACGRPAAVDPDSPDVAPDACTAALTIPVESLVGHNTSANPTYDRAHFAANFGPTTWISQAGATLAIDPALADMSLDPVTPGHVSSVDVHTLVPSRPDLRWFSHLVPWFKPGGGNHIDIGIDSSSPAYIATMIEDMKRRGFDGVIIDWYGKDSYEDKALLEIQKYLAVHPGFSYIAMIDKGVAGLSEVVLEQQLAYLAQTYYGDPSYERDNGKPIVMFFGVTDALGVAAMATAKAHSTSAVWVVQGTSQLGTTWDDQAFDWVHDFHDGPSATDPYNLATLRGYYATVKAGNKPAFGGLAPGFDGMLTKSVAWSKGKYLARGNGACLVESAAQIDAVIPANVTRMQVVTWNDWEEGSAIEAGVETGVAVTASRDGSALAWSITGDERTVDHYEIYATDGTNAADLGSAPRGTHAFDVGCATGDVFVIAVGVALTRDHASNRS